MEKTVQIRDLVITFIKPQVDDKGNQTYKEYDCFRFYSKSKDTWKRVFSNFYASPFILNNYVYATVEHYYQIEKFRYVGQPYMVDNLLRDNESYLIIQENKILPKLKSELEKDRYLAGLSAKKLAISYNKIVKAKPNSTHKLSEEKGKSIMRQGIYAKFSSNLELLIALIITNGHYLSHLTRFRPSLALTSNKSAYRWGEMATTREVLRTNPAWKSLEIRYLSDSTTVILGKNIMGRILMEVRDTLLLDIKKYV